MCSTEGLSNNPTVYQPSIMLSSGPWPAEGAGTKPLLTDGCIIWVFGILGVPVDYGNPPPGTGQKTHLAPWGVVRTPNQQKASPFNS